MADADDPLADHEADGSPEQVINGEVAKIGSAMVARLKKDAERKKIATSGDDYVVVVFEDGAQASKFLSSAGYPSPGDAFIDGLILADLLGIELPAGKTIAPLRKSHPQKYTRLIVNKKWRGKG